jgi:hypothetical protein
MKVLPLDHEYVYGCLPPDGVQDALPFADPLQVGLPCAIAVTDNAFGCAIVTAAVEEPEQLSVTVTVYVPAERKGPVGLNVLTTEWAAFTQE